MKKTTTITQIFCDMCEKEIPYALPELEVKRGYFMEAQVASVNIKIYYSSLLGISDHICGSCAIKAMEAALTKLKDGNHEAKPFS
jgi:hypothetical protein